MNPTTKRMYEIALKAPGLDPTVKVITRLSKKSILFITRLIDMGLAEAHKADDDFLSLMNDEIKEEIKHARDEILKRSDLDGYYADLIEL